MKRALLYILLFYPVIALSFKNDDVIRYQDGTKLPRIGKYLSFYEDRSNQLSIEKISHLNFIPCDKNLPDFGMSSNTYWVKFTFENQSDIEDFLLEFNRIYAKDLRLYHKSILDNNFIEQKFNEYSKKHIGRLFFFEFSIPKAEKRVFYLKFKTVWSYSFPIKISPQKTAFKQLFNQELIGGIYLGIILIMVFYNSFIYFSIKDSSYLYYVIYIASFLLFQFNELGYGYKYIWYQKPHLFHVFTKAAPILSCIAAIYFVRDFLKTKKHTPLLHKIYNLLIVCLAVILLTVISNDYNGVYFLTLNIVTFVVSIYTLAVAIIIMRKGFSPAKFFLIAWLILILSIIQFTLSNLGLIPYYSFTNYSLEIGSIIEIVLLSFGLAYRINVLMREKEKSQAEALLLSKENELIITKQKQELENLVIKRTKKLEIKNTQILDQNEEKSTMMREIHHRVKNNLQMINSMIRMQSKFVTSSTFKNVLNKVQRRIIVMAQLHEKMYLSKDLKSIIINNYIENMIADIFKNDTQQNSYNLDITKELTFNTENALSIGLLINELTNHTLNKSEKNSINIQLYQTQNNEYVLTFSDNNNLINYQELIDSSSLTKRLVMNFTKQLNGTITVENQPSNINLLKIKFYTL